MRFAEKSQAYLIVVVCLIEVNQADDIVEILQIIIEILYLFLWQFCKKVQRFVKMDFGLMRFFCFVKITA